MGIAISILGSQRMRIAVLAVKPPQARITVRARPVCRLPSRVLRTVKRQSPFSRVRFSSLCMSLSSQPSSRTLRFKTVM